MDALIDYTERLVRQEIATWPDGTASFTDYLGSDGVDVCDVPITAHVTIAGDEVTADLTDSAPMVRGSLNSTRSFVAGLRLPGGARRADGRGAEHGRRVPADPHPHEAGHDRRGRDAGRLLDARRDRLPRRSTPSTARSRSCSRTASPPRARAATRSRSSARSGPDGEPLHLLRARRRHLGRDAGGRRQRRPHEPGEPRREHPGRGRRVRVPDRGRALRARARLGRRRPAPRRPRDRARLALPDAATRR